MENLHVIKLGEACILGSNKKHNILHLSCVLDIMEHFAGIYIQCEIQQVTYQHEAQEWCDRNKNADTIK